MSSQAQQIHGFRLSNQKLSNDRSTWEYYAANPAQAASVCLSQKRVTEQLKIIDKFSDQSFDRLVNQILEVYRFEDIKWHFTKGTAIPKGELVRVDLLDFRGLISKQINDFKAHREQECVEINIGNGRVVRGEVFRVSPFNTKGDKQIIPTPYAELEFKSLSTDQGRDFYFQGTLVHSEAKNPMVFKLKTEVFFGDVLIERKEETFSPIFKKVAGQDLAGAFMHFTRTCSEPEFMLP